MSHTADGNVKCAVTLKSSMAVSQKVKCKMLPYNQLSPILIVYLREMEKDAHTKAFLWTFIWIVSITAENLQWLTCSAPGEVDKHALCIHAVEYYSAIQWEDARWIPEHRWISKLCAEWEKTIQNISYLWCHLYKIL